jgi:hypothetical protein
MSTLTTREENTPRQEKTSGNPSSNRLTDLDLTSSKHLKHRKSL